MRLSRRTTPAVHSTITSFGSIQSASRISSTLVQLSVGADVGAHEVTAGHDAEQTVVSSTTGRRLIRAASSARAACDTDTSMVTAEAVIRSAAVAVRLLPVRSRSPQGEHGGVAGRCIPVWAAGPPDTTLTTTPFASMTGTALTEWLTKRSAISLKPTCGSTVITSRVITSPTVTWRMAKPPMVAMIGSTGPLVRT